MQFLSLIYWLLGRRLRHSWLLLVVTSFGILASVTIMSTGALYYGDTAGYLFAPGCLEQGGAMAVPSRRWNREFAGHPGGPDIFRSPGWLLLRPGPVQRKAALAAFPGCSHRDTAGICAGPLLRPHQRWPAARHRLMPRASAAAGSAPPGN